MKLKLAIIDDGISSDTVSDLAFNLVCKNGILQEASSEANFFSHGSICAAIIRKYAPQAEIGSIRILGADGRGEPGDLAAALEWCVLSGIKMIHLSIGSTQPCDVPLLYEAVNKVSKSGGIIIAACKTGHNVSFPASFAKVIGVRAGESLTGPQYTANREPNGGIEFSANASHDVVVSPFAEPFAASKFNSYAAPVISAVVYKLLLFAKCGASLPEIRAQLYKEAAPAADGKWAGNDLTDKVPVVAFAGNQYRASMRAVARKFLDDNYLPLLFSQFAEDCSPECFFLADWDALESHCHHMAGFYGADLVLAMVSGDDPVGPEADVVVYSGQNGSNPDKIFLS
jgi:hypothetical protein